MEFVYNGKELKNLNFEQICDFLKINGDIKKAEFDKKLIKTAMTIYGYSANEINSLYKYFSSVENDILNYPSDVCYEITLLQGLLIVKSGAPLEENLPLLRKWISYVDNWAHCDMVASKIKHRKTEKDRLFDFARELLNSKNEFVVRCGVIILFGFLDEQYIDAVFTSLNGIDYGKYYIDMAVAWLCATSLIKFKNKTLDFLENSTKINDFTYLKSLQKARESYRISAEDKTVYKELIALKRRK